MKLSSLILSLTAILGLQASAANLLTWYDMGDTDPNNPFKNVAPGRSGDNTFGGIDAGIYMSTLSKPVISGSSSYWSVNNNHAVYNGNTNGYTSTNMAVSMWINPNTLPAADATNPSWTTQWIFGGGSVNGNAPKLGIGPDGQLKFSLQNDGGASLASAGNVISISKWTQIGFSLTANPTGGANTLTLYVNGIAVASNTNYNKAMTWSNKSALCEGADSTTSGRYNGGLDDVKVWSVTDQADAASAMRTEAGRLIPEPSTVTLGLAGLAAFMLRRRRTV